MLVNVMYFTESEFGERRGILETGLHVSLVSDCYFCLFGSLDLHFWRHSFAPGQSIVAIPGRSPLVPPTERNAHRRLQKIK